MGIRFACHACGKALHIKSELAGRRGKCPKCQERFRIPMQDAERSISLSEDDVGATASALPSDVHQPTDELAAGRRGSTNPETVEPETVGPMTVDSRGGGERVGGGGAGKPSTTSAAEDAWYVRPPGGGQFGPASRLVFQGWVDEGRISAETLLWRPGWNDWRLAADVFSQDSIASSPPPPLQASAALSAVASPPQGQSEVQQPAFDQPAAGRSAAAAFDPGPMAGREHGPQNGIVDHGSSKAATVRPPGEASNAGSIQPDAKVNPIDAAARARRDRRRGRRIITLGLLVLVLILAATITFLLVR